MKLLKLSMVALIFGVFLSSLIVGQVMGEDKTWTYGGVEYRLPKPMDQIQIPADLPEYHEVVPGDCLWFIAKHYLNDPFLWPLIWEENLDTISNPHLIYPGQKVKLPGGTLVATGETPPPVEATAEEEEEETGEETADLGSGLKPKPPEPHPVTTETDIIASGLISKEKLTGPKILGADTESYNLAAGDVVYLNAGTEKGIEPEKDFFVMRKMHKVYHPISGKFIGYMYHIVAEAKGLCAGDETSSAVLGTTYHPVVRGDFLVPQEEIPVPVTLGSPPTDPCNPSTKKYPGTIIDCFWGGPGFSDAVILGKGDIAYIDLGSKDGIAPGDYFTIFKNNQDDPNLPRYVAGELMVVKIYETTSVAVITQSRTGLFVGDYIELKQ